MIGRFVAWRRERTAWRRDHLASFKVAAMLDEAGLTDFQTKAAARLATYVAPHAFSRGHGANGVGLSAPVRGSGAELTIFDLEANIYGDGNDIRFEEWDFRTPEDLMSTIEHALRRLSKQQG